jgi:hypothetical protein
VLTSSASTQYSFDASESGLSTYTQYIVNGIATGEADLNHDGQITIDELHEYAKARVQATRHEPADPPTREGYSIVISAARKADPGRAYAAKVREVASAGGELTRVAAQVLALRRAQLGLSDAQADAIEATELGPRRARANARATLRRAVYQARRRGRIHSEQSLLNELRVALDLGESELAALLAEPLSAQQAIVLGGGSGPSVVLLATGVLAVVAALTYFALSWTNAGPEKPLDPGVVTQGPAIHEHPRQARPASSRTPPRRPRDPPPRPPPSSTTSRCPASPPAEPDPPTGLDTLPPAPGSEPPSNPDITTSSWVLRLSSDSSLDEAKQLISPRLPGRSARRARPLAHQLDRVRQRGLALLHPHRTLREQSTRAQRLLPTAKPLLGQRRCWTWSAHGRGGISLHAARSIRRRGRPCPSLSHAPRSPVSTASSSSRSIGFPTYPEAPRSSARACSSSSDATITGTLRSPTSPRISASMSQLSLPATATPSTIACGRTLWAIASPCAASRQQITVSASSCSARWICSCVDGSSSMTSSGRSASAVGVAWRARGVAAPPARTP